MQVNKLHLNCGTEGGYPGGIQRVKKTTSLVELDKLNRLSTSLYFDGYACAYRQANFSDPHCVQA